MAGQSVCSSTDNVIAQNQFQKRSQMDFLFNSYPLENETSVYKKRKISIFLIVSGEGRKRTDCKKLGRVSYILLYFEYVLES